jgi:hypothetical protein
MAIVTDQVLLTIRYSTAELRAELNKTVHPIFIQLVSYTISKRHSPVTLCSDNWAHATRPDHFLSITCMAPRGRGTTGKYQLDSTSPRRL